MIDSTAPALLSDAETAAFLGIGRSTVWTKAKRGELPPPVRVCGVTRWRRADLDAFVASLPAEPLRAA